MSPVTQTVLFHRVFGIYSENSLEMQSFWILFQKVYQNAKFLEYFPKSITKRKVFGIFSEKCHETLLKYVRLFKFAFLIGHALRDELSRTSPAEDFVNCKGKRNTFGF